MNALQMPPASQTTKRQYIVELQTGETMEVSAVDATEAWALACDEWQYWPSTDKGRVRLADEAVAAPSNAAAVLSKLATEAKAAMEALADRIDAGETIDATEMRETLLLAGCTPGELTQLVDLRKERRQAREEYLRALEANGEANKQIEAWRETQRLYQEKCKAINQLVAEADKLLNEATVAQAYSRMAMQGANGNLAFAIAKCVRLGVEIP